LRNIKVLVKNDRGRFIVKLKSNPLFVSSSRKRVFFTRGLVNNLSDIKLIGRTALSQVEAERKVAAAALNHKAAHLGPGRPVRLTRCSNQLSVFRIESQGVPEIIPGRAETVSAESNF
jgi:hypothetical protein